MSGEDRSSMPSVREIIERFGSWNAALRAAGLAEIPDEDVILTEDGRFVKVTADGAVEIDPEVEWHD